MATKLDNIDALLLMELNDLYSTEQQLIEAIPEMAKAAASQELRDAMREHLDQTRRQKKRLDQAFTKLGQKPDAKKCKGIEGIIKEGKEIIKAKGTAEVKDAALIGAAQRVEHYEMAGYGTARSLAAAAGHQEVADLLQETLDEESETDHKLTAVAESHINQEALHAGEPETQWSDQRAKRASGRSRSSGSSTAERSGTSGRTRSRSTQSRRSK